MSVTLVMQAKRDLYFVSNTPGDAPLLFMAKGDCRVMYGVQTNRPGYRPVHHSEENIRLFVPMTKENAIAALEGDNAATDHD